MRDRENLNSTERVLSLDISTKTGWAFCESSSSELKLVSYGLLGPFERNKELQYPLDFYSWSHVVAGSIIKKIEELNPTTIIVEETNKSRNYLSQKILEYIHFLCVCYFVEMDIWPIYMQTGVWRSLVNAKMTKEEKKQNGMVREFKEKNNTVVAKDANGKRIGLYTPKHVSVRIANEYFGLKLKLKHNNEADSLCMCLAWHNQKQKKDKINEPI